MPWTQPSHSFFSRQIVQFLIKINSSRLLGMYWIILSRRTYWTQPVQKDGAQWIKSILWDYFWCHAFIFSTSISFTAIDARQVHIFFKISNAQQCIYFGLIVRFVNWTLTVKVFLRWGLPESQLQTFLEQFQVHKWVRNSYKTRK